MSALVFFDTETTSRCANRVPWEIAIIRREPGGVESQAVISIDTAELPLTQADPEALAIAGFYNRHPQHGAPMALDHYLLSEAQAAAVVRDWTAAAAVYGINPGFDLHCLLPMLARHGYRPEWFYQPQDVTVLAAEWLLARGMTPLRDVEALSWQCAVMPPGHDRHTALGDATWARRWFDALHSPVVEAGT